MTDARRLPILLFESATAWETWLREERASSPGIWLKLAKKGSGVVTVTYAEALEVALCYGWIDGQKAPLDEQFWLQRFTARRPKSKWSARNRTIVATLIADGRMTAAGLLEIDRAKSDGRWEAAYPAQSNAMVPDDLRAALDADPQASAFFATLSAANRYAILYRIHDAKKPETRARRIAKYVEMCANKEALR